MLAITLSSALALSLQAAPAPDLTLQQRTSMRCAAAFAIVAQGQQAGNRQALAFPALGNRGKEFFVRASAKLMDETGLSREQVSAVLSAEAQALWDGQLTEQVMPACLSLLDASGL